MSTTANGRTSEADVDPMFLERWSPRAFTGEAMPPAELAKLFEAARWAPSAFNAQPWRFVYAHRDTAAWEPLFGLLAPFNQMWAKNAAVVIYLVSDRKRRMPGSEPQPSRTHTFDAGAAWGYLALAASRNGWAAHGMAGFDRAASYGVLGVPEAEYEVEAAIVVGRQADASVLDEAFRAREVPSPRNPLDSFTFEGRFPG